MQVSAMITALASSLLCSGERMDVVVCANQSPGNYLIEANYDLANFLEAMAVPKMPKVDSSKFWAFLHYAGQEVPKTRARKKILGGASCFIYGLC